MSEFVNYDITPYIHLIEKHFPSHITIDESHVTLERRLHFNNTPNDLQDSNYKDYVDLVDSNIGPFYKKIDGPNWKKDKVEEMKHDKLVYISYYSETNKLIAFISFVLTFDEYELSRIFYLYEIHISKNHQKAHLGTQLINKFHSLNETPNVDDLSIDKIETFKLTVFSDNEVAVNWYRKLGYQISSESPTDRTLRSGRVIKPDYYIMVKHTSSLMVTR
ncbi:hypothetical protein WICPIJ_003855 [Wickerhamomyces pijperi]|uniref:N-alpha-acetyltransferase 40 n=1 Tax=Wickerhamomyces pijperi TaxID=599730 RepID=A0A9P8Q959_WICPI|nr:hypothetical protein WICPIJ_003855 [Wickerhamomyces pijperi]